MTTEFRKELINKWNFLMDGIEIGTIELNTWEDGFLDSIEPQLDAEDGFLTDGQIIKLEQIYDKYSMNEEERDYRKRGGTL